MASEEHKANVHYETERAYVPPRQPVSDFPLIDNDPHVKRVFGYMRGSDLAWGAGLTAFPPAAITIMEKYSPTFVGHKEFKSIVRLNVGLGLISGVVFAYWRSINRFYGATENAREVEMDMREMTDRVKKGLSLYGESRLSDYMQGVAARNSRYSGTMLHLVPMVNFVNHPYHGVDTAKYYAAAEKELEREGGRK